MLLTFYNSQELWNKLFGWGLWFFGEGSCFEMKKISISLYQYLGWGLGFALAGEIFNNLIVLHNSGIIILIILPIYLLFFLLAYYLSQKLRWSPLAFSLIFGLIGLILIENLILHKFTESWPIQIFMFCFWFAIVSYPLIIIKKYYLSILVSIILAIVAASISYLIKPEVFLTLAILQFVFWISSAIINFQYLLRVKEY
jgi:hypothetical protein